MTNAQFEKLVDDFFNLSTNRNYNYSYTPSKMAVDLVDDRLEIAYLVVGHDPKNVEVSLTQDKINIRAKVETEDKSVYGQFVKNIDETLNLTKEYDGTTATAEIRNGILKIVVDKKEEQKPKKISIKF
jgi:HSP20 family protein